MFCFTVKVFTFAFCVFCCFLGLGLCLFGFRLFALGMVF